MKIRFDESFYDDESADVIACAHCGWGYTHQNKVEVFIRDKEDSETGSHTFIEGDCYKPSQILIDTSMKGNPSSRRDGISIYIDCEECGKTTAINIAQYKGITLISSEKV